MKLLNTILGINLPTVDELKENIEENVINQVAEPPLAYLSFTLSKDGGVHINTEWSQESTSFAEVYAHFLYQINNGAMEDGIKDILIKYASERINSQDFISHILNKMGECKEKYKSIPIIEPSKVFKVEK